MAIQSPRVSRLLGPLAWLCSNWCTPAFELTHPSYHRWLFAAVLRSCLMYKQSVFDIWYCVKYPGRHPGSTHYESLDIRRNMASCTANGPPRWHPASLGQLASFHECLSGNAITQINPRTRQISCCHENHRVKRARPLALSPWPDPISVHDTCQCSRNEML